MPLLSKFVQATDGAVMELGSGAFSTSLLHWLCAENRRRLVTYERNPKYFKSAKTFMSKTHSIRLVEDWDKIPFEDAKDMEWDVVFIDNELERRSIDPIRLKNKTKFMIIHDTSQDDYGYEKVWPHFKYRYDWKFSRPRTSVVSNFIDIRGLI